MKKRRTKRRVLAALMTACMVAGAVPGVSLAENANGMAPEKSLSPSSKGYTFAGTETDSADPDIQLSKTAVYDAETDEYTITLSAEAKKLIKTKPTHVVFVLDASGSMNYCTEKNLKNKDVTEDEKERLSGHVHYILYKNPGWGQDKYQLEDYLGNGCTLVDAKQNESRWKIAKSAIQTMSENLGTDGITYDYVWFNTNAGESSSEPAYSDVTPEGFTVLVDGINKAKEKFKSDSADTDKVMIIVADGDAQKKSWNGYGTYYPKNEVKEFKDQGGKVYTVGFTFSNVEFDNLSSGNGYNFNATDESALKVSLNKISQNIKSLISDPLGDNVSLAGSVAVEGSNVPAQVNSDGNVISWNDPNGLQNVTLTYKVKVKDSAKTTGEVKLNGDAVLNYTDGKNTKTIPFPTPSVTGATLKVEYVDDNNTVVKNDEDWIGLTGGNVSFKKITDIPETITVGDMTYYVISSDPETIPTPTEGEEYKVTVRVSTEKPNQAIYSVIYDANGGSWKEDYTAKEHYSLNAERTTLTRSEMNYSDMIEVLGGNDAPERSGYVFKGWKLTLDDVDYPLVSSAPVGRAADDNHEVHLNAIWEEDVPVPDEATYVVNKHYIDTDENDPVYNESVDGNQTAEEGSLISKKVAHLMTTQEYYYTNYLYKRATVTVGDDTEGYTDDSTFKSGKNIIDLYYYRDSWNEIDGSETGGDEIPDIDQVLVKFGNKDGNGTVTEKENAEKNTGIIQVYTLEDGQTVVTPSLKGVEVTPADGYEFAKWTKNNRDNSGIKPDIEQTVKGGDELDFWAWFDEEEPQDPDFPTYDELKDIIGNVVLVHTGSNAEHQDAEYELIEGSYDIASASNARVTVTVKAAAYKDAYNEENGTHTVQGKSSAKVVLWYDGDAWELMEGDFPVTFTVKCSENKPVIPDLPKDDELKKLFGESIIVTCTTDADHAAETFGLMTGSYSVTRSKDDENEAVVTVRAAKYIEAFADGKHTNAGSDAARVTLVYDKEDGKWYAADQEISINFKAKCEKVPDVPEKKYANIKFVVVNGTFTENGGTEITKSFEVGTKMTLADIPASKGKSSSYSDATWDKYPLGYVVGEEGTTFTITYKWKSTGGNGGGGGGGGSHSSVRTKATNAAGKSGRWILEGGEFTEDNGRLPSNEYLKIGDTIYGFYTYGFAIDFDRPEYYTDEAIQAKGGYRDAKGTWRLNGWWFCYDDGTFPHSEWVYLTWNGHSDWYYFDVDGWMEDGWLFWNNNWYYLHTQYDNTRGHMYTGWHEIDGKWYYFNTASDKGTLGAMLADTTTPDGYKVDANGAWIR